MRNLPRRIPPLRQRDSVEGVAKFSGYGDSLTVKLESFTPSEIEARVEGHLNRIRAQQQPDLQ